MRLRNRSKLRLGFHMIVQYVCASVFHLIMLNLRGICTMAVIMEDKNHVA